MARRVIFGVVWSVVLYFGACAVVGAGAGFVATAGMRTGEDPAAVGSRAGANAVLASRLFLALGAVSTGLAGSYFQVLPGTREKRPRPRPSSSSGTRPDELDRC